MTGAATATYSISFTAPRATVHDVCVLTLVALAVNCYGIADKSIWLDEASSVEYVMLGWRGMWHFVLPNDPNSLLYYSFMSAWIPVFGTGEVSVRLPSAIFFSLTTPVVYLIGVRCFTRTVGIGAAVLFALNAFVVSYAQMARGYGLLLFLTCVASLCLVRELERPDRFNRIGYVVAGSLAFYVHIFAGFVLLSHLLVLVAVRRREVLSSENLGTVGAVILCCAPMIALVARTDSGRLDWIPRPSLADLGAASLDLAAGSPWVLAALLVGGAAGMLFAHPSRRRWPHLLLIAWMVVPVLLSFLISQIMPIMQAQYLLLCVPALTLFGASGLASLRWPVSGALIVGLAGLMTRPLQDYYRRERPENWREAVGFVRSLAQSGDGIVFVPDYVNKPFRFYMPGRAVAPLVTLRDEPVNGRNRVWLVASPRHLSGPGVESLRATRDSLQSTHRSQASRRLRGVEVEYFVR